jgi:hypothetical protein
MTRHSVKQRLTLTMCWCLMLAACDGARPGGPEVSPVYNQETGKLEKLISDKNGDGKVDTWAFMDGAVLKYIEQDRNGDGQPDRWEYYEEGTISRPGKILRADEANGPSKLVTRREQYDGGVIRRVTDDTDGDSRPDKWETISIWWARAIPASASPTGREAPSRASRLTPMAMACSFRFRRLEARSKWQPYLLCYVRSTPPIWNLRRPTRRPTCRLSTSGR